LRRKWLGRGGGKTKVLSGDVGVGRSGGGREVGVLGRD